MGEVPNWGSNFSKGKALTAFFPYAVQQAQNGQHEMLDAFLHAIRALREPWFMWQRIEPFVTALLDKKSHIPKRQAMILASPHLPWWSFKDKHLVQLWAVAASEVPYTDEIGQSVVNTLLHIASNDNLQPHIPISMWLWLNKQPTFPPVCAGRAMWSTPDVVEAVHDLGDAEILKSYLLLVWSEWDCLYSRWTESPGYYSDDYLFLKKNLPHKRDTLEMHASIRMTFGRVGMSHHRKDLLQQLDRILGQLDLGLDYLQQYKPSLKEDDVQLMKKQYGKLKDVLLEVGQKE